MEIQALRLEKSTHDINIAIGEANHSKESEAFI